MPSSIIALPTSLQIPQVLDAFVSDGGRQPAAGELEFLVAAQTRKFQGSQDLMANGMRHVNAGIPGLLSRYRVQLVAAPSWMGFVLADQPYYTHAPTRSVTASPVSLHSVRPT
jgi:hypothetical protein